MLKNKKPRKTYYLLLVLSFLVLIILLVQGLSDENNASKQSGDQENQLDLSFGKNYIGYVLMPDESITFNLWAIQNVQDEKSDIYTLINAIEFDNENISIEDYEISAGIVHEGYRLINFILDVKVNSYDVEMSDKIWITDKNNNKHEYEFGDIVVQQWHENPAENISPKGEYVTIYPEPQLEISLASENESEITINKIYDIGNKISYNFTEKLILRKGDTIEANAESVETFDQYDFYTVSPIAEYKIDDKIEEYVLPGILYGHFMQDIDKITTMLENKNDN